MEEFNSVVVSGAPQHNFVSETEFPYEERVY